MKQVAMFLAVTLTVAVGQQMPERKLYWIHGLKESSSFWNRYYTLFPQTHKVDFQRSRNVDYTSVGSITNIATMQVVPQLPPLDPNEPITAHPIGIGHSMGGLIARTIEQSYRGRDARFCAIITVGTPNTGALIVNNIANGAALHALESGMVTILRPLGNILGLVLNPVNLIVMKATPENLPWAFGVGATLGEMVFGEIANNLTESLRSSIDIYTIAPASDMIVGSLYIESLRTREHQVPLVAIWGNEDPRCVFRLACSFIRRDLIPYECLDSTYDGCVENIANTVTDFAMYTKTVLRVAAVVTLFAIFVEPQLLPLLPVALSVANNFEMLEWYCRVDAENTWRRLIGATWVDTIRRRVSQYYYNPYTRQQQRIPSIVINEQDLGDPELYQQYRQSLESRYEVIRILNESPSDALIVKESQIGIPGLLQAYEAKGANHLEQGNHRNVREAFELIFDLQNNEFRTPRRR